MVRPEPHQTLRETDLGGERSVDARPHLLEEDVAADRRLRRLGRHRRRRRAGGGLLHAVAHRPAFGLLALDLLLLAHRQDLLGLTLGVGVGDRAERLRARLQVGARDQAGARPVEFGQQRPARVGGDRHD